MLSRGAPPSNRLQHVRASEGAELSPSEAAASTLLSQRRRGPMAFATKAPLLLMAIRHSEMALVRTVYRLLQKTARDFSRASIPLTGVINTDLRSAKDGPQHLIRQHFRQQGVLLPASGSGDNIDGMLAASGGRRPIACYVRLTILVVAVALDLLAQLQNQLQALQQTDKDTRQVCRHKMRRHTQALDR